MEEPNKDVEVVESSATEVSQEGVTTAEQPRQPTTDAEPTIETAPPVGQQTQAVDSVDDMGVPWKNRAMELQRKYDKTQKQQEEILEKLSSLSQPQQPQYTTEQLEAFAAHPDTTEVHRLWAINQIRAREEQKMANLVRSEFDKRDQATRTEQQRKDALNHVMQRHPDAFIRNQQGQIIAWNTNSPLTQRIGAYMNDPEISNNPRGLLVASALAYQDLAMTNQAKTQQKVQQLKNEAGALKKQTLVEAGGNTNIPQPTARQTAVDKTRSGKLTDAVDAMKELWKATGRLQE